MKDFFISHGRWYYTLTFFTGGILAWVAFLHASGRLHDPDARQKAKIYGILAVPLFALVGLTPTDAAGEPTGAVGAFLSFVTGVYAIALIAAACYQVRPLQVRVYPRRTPGVAVPQPSRDEAAVQRAMHARQRRQEARALAQRDPALARDLGIGLPGQARDYDDGGLVDLNRVDAATLRHVMGLDAADAEQVVATREAWGTGYASVEELLAHVTVSEHQAEILRDRGIVLPR